MDIEEPFRKSTNAISSPITTPKPPHNHPLKNGVISASAWTAAPFPAKLVTRNFLATSSS